MISKEIKIGLFVSLMLIGLVWGVNFLQGMDIFGKTNSLYAVFDDVDGLQTTSPISIKGMKVGSVGKIKFEQKEKKFIVELQIKSNYEIPTNSIAYIHSVDIMGSKAIKLKLGDSPEMFVGKERISSAVEVDMISLLAEDLPSIKDALKRTIINVDTTFTNLNKLLNDNNIDNLSKGFLSLKNTLNNLDVLTASLNKDKELISSTLSNLDNITDNLKSKSGSINNIIDNFSDLSDSLKAVRINEVVDKLSDILNQVNSENGTVGKLLNNDSLYNNLLQSVESLDLLLADIKANPKRYINISVFGGKKNK